MRQKKKQISHDLSINIVSHKHYTMAISIFQTAKKDPYLLIYLFRTKKQIDMIPKANKTFFLCRKTRRWHSNVSIALTGAGRNCWWQVTTPICLLYGTFETTHAMSTVHGDRRFISYYFCFLCGFIRNRNCVVWNLFVEVILEMFLYCWKYKLCDRTSWFIICRKTDK